MENPSIKVGQGKIRV